MNKIILNLKNVNDIVLENKYKVNIKTKFFSRCIDGRYENSNDLPALGFPGADVGELALILATANSYGFDVDKKKILDSFLKVIGGKENFRLHTDSHADKEIPAAGCGHWKQIKLDPKAYNLEKDQLDFVEEAIKAFVRPSQSYTLEGDHLEGAVLLLEGNFGVYPRFVLPSGKEVQVFVYHQTLVDQRHRQLAKQLIEDQAVIFKNGENEEWLYNALSDVSEDHLMETVKRLAKGLPIYSVVFEKDGSFNIQEQGVV